MKEQELLLKELALMLERQDMLSKLTEGKCLDEYGYSETHCIDYIGRLELPNVTKIAEHMGMTRGAGVIPFWREGFCIYRRNAVIRGMICVF